MTSGDVMHMSRPRSTFKPGTLWLHQLSPHAFTTCIESCLLHNLSPFFTFCQRVSCSSAQNKSATLSEKQLQTFYRENRSRNSKRKQQVCEGLKAGGPEPRSVDGTCWRRASKPEPGWSISGRTEAPCVALAAVITEAFPTWPPIVCHRRL